MQTSISHTLFLSSVACLLLQSAMLQAGTAAGCLLLAMLYQLPCLGHMALGVEVFQTFFRKIEAK